MSKGNTNPWWNCNGSVLWGLCTRILIITVYNVACYTIMHISQPCLLLVPKRNPRPLEVSPLLPSQYAVHTDPGEAVIPALFLLPLSWFMSEQWCLCTCACARAHTHTHTHTHKFTNVHTFTLKVEGPCTTKMLATTLTSTRCRDPRTESTMISLNAAVSPVCQRKWIMWYVFIAAQQETESVKKQYTKLLDGYGCLGVLQLNAGRCAKKLDHFHVPSHYICTSHLITLHVIQNILLHELWIFCLKHVLAMKMISFTSFIVMEWDKEGISMLNIVKE
jgi:hypothetical protein